MSPGAFQDRGLAHNFRAELAMSHLPIARQTTVRQEGHDHHLAL